MEVESTSGRARVEEEYGKLTISIPSTGNLFISLFLLFWLGGWAVGETSALKQVLAWKGPLFGNAFILFWLGGWTVGGVFVAYQILWGIFGKEVIQVEPQYLIIGKRVGPLGFSKKYALTEAGNLRVVENMNEMDIRMARWIPWSRYGTIAFDYGAKTVRFAQGLDPAEAGQVVAKIRSRSYVK